MLDVTIKLFLLLVRQLKERKKGKSLGTVRWDKFCRIFVLRRNLSVFTVGFFRTLDLSGDPAKKEMYRDKRYLVSSKCFSTLEAFAAQATGDS